MNGSTVISIPSTTEQSSSPPHSPSLIHSGRKHHKRCGSLGFAKRVQTPPKPSSHDPNAQFPFSLNTNSSAHTLLPSAANYYSQPLEEDVHSSRRSSGDTSTQSAVCGGLSVSEEELKRRPWSIEDFSLGKPLGKGKFGNVYFARQRGTQAPVALKVLFKAPLQSEAKCYAFLRREVEIQCRLAHPNIVRLFGYFQEEKRILLVLEYLPNELFKHLSKQGGVVDETTAKAYLSHLGSV